MNTYLAACSPQTRSVNIHLDCFLSKGFAVSLSFFRGCITGFTKVTAIPLATCFCKSNLMLFRGFFTVRTFHTLNFNSLSSPLPMGHGSHFQRKWGWDRVRSSFWAARTPEAWRRRLERTVGLSIRHLAHRSSQGIPGAIFRGELGRTPDGDRRVFVFSLTFLQYPSCYNPFPMKGISCLKTS